MEEMSHLLLSVPMVTPPLQGETMQSVTATGTERSRRVFSARPPGVNCFAFRQQFHRVFLSRNWKKLRDLYKHKIVRFLFAENEKWSKRHRKRFRKNKRRYSNKKYNKNHDKYERDVSFPALKCNIATLGGCVLW